MSRNSTIASYKKIFSDPQLSPVQQDRAALSLFMQQESGYSRANQLDLLHEIEKIAGRKLEDIHLWIELQ